MNFRILAAPIWPRGRVFALLAATALATSFLASEVQAQAPAPAPAAPKAKPKAAPKAAPAAPAPTAQQAAPPPAAGAPAAGAPAAGAQPQDQQVQLIYAPWTKFCLKGQDANAKQVCFTGKDGRIESGQPVIAAVIIEPEGEPKKILRVTLPLGMQLIHGTRVIVDSNPPMQSPYVICFANGCMSDYEVTPELLANMKKGQNLVVQAINSNGAPLTLPLPLAEFAKAYDGPPTDPKVFEETQKKLQEELQKRAEEARAKLQANSPAGAAPATPAPAAK
ncbi:invasion associated locus B family protein [Bradyrhizobium canariense]|uniref:Invasion protein IalB, involved in pathogenesis n=1 Tax=Bradyrhizobium canariense TaxID=255045 RepID=A0A1H1Q8W7_9BRAD|nr:invasion associated locus B family protein [Bradyrhizobium canariense]SDS19727.1 Invasion protein IalB, involved in pathogenesis [Bradyrhizobium canariense]